MDLFADWNWKILQLSNLVKLSMWNKDSFTLGNLENFMKFYMTDDLQKVLVTYM